MPRFGSTANACTEVSTPERTRKVPSRLSAKATIASSTVQLRKRAALLGHRERMDERGADQPGHEGGVLHRVPEPPAAPAELVVRPAAAERDAEREEAPRPPWSTGATSAPRRRRAGRRAAPRSRRRTPPRSRRSPCRASAGGAPCPGPAAADSGRGRRAARGNRRSNGFEVNSMKARKPTLSSAHHAEHARHHVLGQVAAEQAHRHHPHARASGTTAGTSPRARPRRRRRGTAAAARCWSGSPRTAPRNRW